MINVTDVSSDFYHYCCYSHIIDAVINTNHFSVILPPNLWKKKTESKIKATKKFSDKFEREGKKAEDIIR